MDTNHRHFHGQSALQLFFAKLLITVAVSCCYVDGRQLTHQMESLVNSFQTPSHYSASSSLENYGANQASGSVFDSKGDDSPRAWCPRWPVKDERREWLQLDFDDLKVIEFFITWGLSSKPDHFVPYFFLRYDRGDGRWRDFISYNGTRIIVANQDNTQAVTISLSPPVTARRIRIIPYRLDFSQSMCLRISVLGHSFDVSLLSYKIPEGDIYRTQRGDSWAALNDSSYDGILLPGGDQRNSLVDGLGVLVDRWVYTNGEIKNALEPPFSMRNVGSESRQTRSGLVGWFCRSGLSLSPLSPPCHSRNVTLLFTFTSVRQFTDVWIHALNSFKENIAVFREALVQLSVGGEYFDHFTPPVLHLQPRNISSTQPMWVVIPLKGRVGRFVKITLTFDSDWIILSEVAFNSTSLTEDMEVEKVGVSPQAPVSVLLSAPKRVSAPLTSNKTLGQNEPSSSPLPQAQPPSLEDSSDLSLIIGSVCVVGLVLVVSVFVYILCRLCRGGSRGNPALLNKSTNGRDSDPGDCGTGGSGTACRKAKLMEGSTNGLTTGVDGRFLTFGSITPSGAYCLTNTMAASDVSSPSKPADLYSPFHGNDGMMQTLQLIQHQHHKSQGSNYDLSFRQLMQPTSGFGTLITNGGGGAHLSIVGGGGPFFQAPPPPPPPPPPDQPLPPLPPVTPTSSINNSGSHHRPSSTVNPYAASSAVSFLVNGAACTSSAAMITSTHTDGSMAEYASASLISGQTGYTMRPPSIHGVNGGLIFMPQSSAYPNVQSSTSQDVFLHQPSVVKDANGSPACSGSFTDNITPHLSVLPSLSEREPFFAVNSTEQLTPRESMR